MAGGLTAAGAIRFAIKNSNNCTHVHVMKISERSETEKL
jgi:hypothetical protein